MRQEGCPPSSAMGYALPMSDERIVTGFDASDLSERERMILAAIVETHIDSCEPVGSRTIAERLEVKVSPATIRNVMSALSERGFIQKPHTSAGRIPTGQGLRFYVDTMLRLELPPDQAKAEIDATLRRPGSLEGAMGEAGKVLSRLSQHACLIRAPRSSAVRLKQIEFVLLRKSAVLVVLVSAEGMVQNRLVTLSHAQQEAMAKQGGNPADLLAAMSRRLSEQVEGRTLDEVRATLQSDIAGASEEIQELTRSLAAPALDEQEASEEPLRLEGEHHLLDPADERSLSRMKELYAVVEEKESLIGLIDGASDAPGVRIFIGQESGYRGLSEMSLVTATYGREGEILGSLGVIGPMHMDYGRVVPLVQFTASAVSRLLSSLGEGR